jgi:predicted GNAT family acetyltransferase
MRCSTRCGNSSPDARVEQPFREHGAAVPVTRHTDAEAFLAAAAPLTAANPAIDAFVAMLVGAWRASGTNVEGAYAATCDDDGARGFAVAFPGRAVVLENSAPQAARAFAADVPDGLSGISCVHGERSACSAFAAAWCRRFPRRYREAAHLRHHHLQHLARVPVPAGAMRVAADADLAWLTTMSLEFAVEARVPDAPATVVEGVQRRLAAVRYRIWDEGGPVAFAAWAPAGDAAARIAPVYTLPRHRGRGYATALTAALSRELLEAGRRGLFLMTDVTNPTSNAIYARIGVRPVSDTYRFDFLPVARP